MFQALMVEISIPVDSAEEGNGMLQAVDALASLLIGQTLPSVVGGKDGAPSGTHYSHAILLDHDTKTMIICFEFGLSAEK